MVFHVFPQIPNGTNLSWQKVIMTLIILPSPA